MKNIVKIGTRSSALALWQAEYVKSLIEKAGAKAELVHIKSEGEINLTSPLYEIGVQGIFTKTLDIALLNGSIDIAVHSFKDVPTQLPVGISLASTPQRGNHLDLLVYKDRNPLDHADIPLTIATSSLRRKAQWLNRFPLHQTEPIRGNINSRMQKLNTTPEWDGSLFAAAGIERIQLEVMNSVELDWMLPAPAQGALGVFCRTDEDMAKEICSSFNDENTYLCTYAERMFLRTLMGGCTMPIAAHARIMNNEIILNGNLLTIDGKEKAEITCTAPKSEGLAIGQKAANEILSKGGQSILDQLRNQQA